MESHVWRLGSLEKHPIPQPSEGTSPEIKIFSLESFKMPKSWLKFCFKISNCCLRISLVPTWTTTISTEGLASSIYGILAEMLYTVVLGKHSGRIEY